MAAFLSRLFSRRPAPRPPDYYERRIEELLSTLRSEGRDHPRTLQGELLRCAHHLFDDGYRHGFTRWSTSGEPAVEFLRRHLPDPRTFDGAQIAAIREALDRIVDAGPQAGFGLPLADLRTLLYRAVDWCDRNPAARPVPRDTQAEI